MEWLARPNSRTGTELILNRGKVGVTEHRSRVEVSERGGTRVAVGIQLVSAYRELGGLLGTGMFLAVMFVCAV